MSVRAAALVPLLLATGACMPWAVGETASTLEPGQRAGGVGLALLVPPAEPHRPLPVPQAWAAVGVMEGADVAVAFAVPLTFQARGKVRLREGEDGGTGLAITMGGGGHGFPDLVGAGRILWTPYMLGGVHASRGGNGASPYAALRLLVPFVLGREPAATLWLAPQVGLELERGALRWGPELGLVIPTVHPAGTQLVAGVSVRWTSLP